MGLVYLPTITTQLQSLRIQICPKISGFPYNPVLGMGLRPTILLDREGSGFLGDYHQNQPNVGKLPDINPMGYVSYSYKVGPGKPVTNGG